MTHKTAASLGATLGIFLGASGVFLLHFTKPVPPPVFVQVEEV